MKKLHITIVLFLWCFAQVAEAQNMYRNYLSTAVPSPESAVSVVHSNGYVYYFQTGKKRLSITELDPVHLSPTTGNETVFDMYLCYNQSIQDFFIQGAFEDFDKNIVLYGYQDNHYYLRGAVMLVIDPTLQRLNYYYLPSSTGSFTEGCAGYNSNGNKIYAFILNDHELCVVDATNLSAIVPPTLITFQKYSLDAIASYTDISWDDTYGKFIATGSYSTSATQWAGPFVDMVSVNANSLSHFMYYLDNLTYENTSESKALHVKIDDNFLLVYHNLWYKELDMFWLTLVKDYDNVNRIISESRVYSLPCEKNTSLDLVYDNTNNRFNFLGNLLYCTSTPYLVQGDPLSLSSGISAGMLDGGMSIPSPCPTFTTPPQDILNTQIQVNKIAFNYYSPCGTVMISGIDHSNSNSILTETMKISQSFCDQPLNLTPLPNSAQIVNLNLTDLPVSTTALSDHQNAISYIVSEQTLCDDPGACSHIYKSSFPRHLSANTEKFSFEVNIYGNSFLCDGFAGTIHYVLYDITGKIIAKGDTENAVHNTFPPRNGVFLLSTSDDSGNQMMTKVVLFN